MEDWEKSVTVSKGGRGSHDEDMEKADSVPSSPHLS